MAPDDVGFWQGALRDPAQELFGVVAAEVKSQGQLYIDLLYGNFEGGQRVVSRFNLVYREPSQLGHAARRPARPRPRAGGWPRSSGTGTSTGPTRASRRPAELGESRQAHTLPVRPGRAVRELSCCRYSPSTRSA